MRHPKSVPFGSSLVVLLLAACPPMPENSGGGAAGSGAAGGGAAGGGAAGGGAAGGGAAGGGVAGVTRFSIATGHPSSLQRDGRGVLHAVVEDDPLAGLRYLRCGPPCDRPSSWQGIVLAQPDIREPSMAVAPDGQVALVWESWVGTKITVVYSQCTAEDCARLDAWSTPVPVAARSDLMQAGSRNLVFDAAGALHLVLHVSTGTTKQMHLTCSSSCDEAASWTGTTFLSAEACSHASLAASGNKLAAACVSSISTGQGVIYAECDENCDSAAYWRWTKPLATSVNGGASLAFENGAPRLAFRQLSGVPHFFACEGNCGLSSSWAGIQWSTLFTEGYESVFLAAPAAGTVRLALASSSSVEVLTCHGSCALPSSAWSSERVDTGDLATKEAVPPACPTAHPEAWFQSFFKGRLSFAVDGQDLALLISAEDLKGCDGTDDYTREANQRARYVRTRIQP